MTTEIGHATRHQTAVFSWAKYVRRVFDRYGVDFVGWPEHVRIEDPKKMSAHDRREILTLFKCGSIQIRRMLQKERVDHRKLRIAMSSKIYHRRQPRNDIGKKRIRTNPTTRKQNRRSPRDDFLSSEFVPQSWDKPARTRLIVEVVLPLLSSQNRELRD